MDKIYKVIAFSVLVIFFGLWAKFTTEAIAKSWFEMQIKVYTENKILTECANEGSK